MRIVMSDFFYYFSLKGSGGGLHSMECKFKPVPAGNEDIEDMKSATRRLMQTHTDILDRLYDDVISGKKEPILADSPGRISTGYEYSGRLKTGKARALDRRLRELFGEETVGPTGEISSFENLRTKVECSFTRRRDTLDDVTVVVKHEMSHVLNVCFFRFIKRLEGIEVGEEPREDMDNLGRMLETTTERKGLDYFEMVTKQ